MRAMIWASRLLSDVCPVHFFKIDCTVGGSCIIKRRRESRAFAALEMTSVIPVIENLYLLLKSLQFFKAQDPHGHP